ncbi:hypothetical protein A3863_14455 [Priestia endophytica]|uniref:hypothetical protein n=1 Tax=Priestia endophytica TaxID=135735 RepID=UPI000DCA88B1|nr:hypothetical protein [Priestia endophytica]RAS88193.1 hypothetical protein A3863_14455 [Priestia endophytica]
MKIGEILEELKRGKTLVDIGKELVVGKEKLSKALKGAGYEFSRKNGWTFKGKGEEPLNQEYTDFIKSSKSVKKANVNISAIDEVSATIEKPRPTDASTSQLSNKTGNKQIVKPVSQETTKPTSKQISKQVGKPTNQPAKNPTIKETSKPSMKKVTYEIEEQLHDELKIKSIREKRTVSEIVNEIIKKGLK